MTDVKLPRNECLDSHDVLAALLGEPEARGRDHLVQQDNGRRGNYGFRVGKWKLQRHDSKRRRNAKLRLKSQQSPRYSLFQLDVDPGETTNVIGKHPQQAAKMIDRLQKLIDAGRSRP